MRMVEAETQEWRGNMALERLQTRVEFEIYAIDTPRRAGGYIAYRHASPPANRATGSSRCWPHGMEDRNTLPRLTKSAVAGRAEEGQGEPVLV
jgi:hypothetical protein